MLTKRLETGFRICVAAISVYMYTPFISSAYAGDVSLKDSIMNTHIRLTEAEKNQRNYFNQENKKVKNSINNSRESYGEFYNKILDKTRREGTNMAGQFIDEVIRYQTGVNPKISDKLLPAWDDSLEKSSYWRRNKNQANQNRINNQKDIKKGFFHRFNRNR